MAVRLGLSGLLSALVVVCAACGGAAARPDGGHGMLRVGDPVPPLSGVDQDGHLVRTSDARGHRLVVFFYPKDGSPGCTTEACAFRDAWDRYRADGVRILGVSTDDQAAHAAFAREHELPFPLVADPSGAWGRAFGIGEGIMGYPRVTFAIDADGRVLRTYPNVDPGVHAAEILADLAGRGRRPSGE